MRPALAFQAVALVSSMLLAVPAMAEPRPVVVELFTSQGCSSCPPADALLSELARRADVLPLAFHVTYWNGLGWRDPFSLDLATDRQRSYQRLLGTDTIYTPQMIVDGRSDVIGSDRPAVGRAIAKAMADQTVAISATRGPRGLEIQVGKGAPEEAGVFVVGYDGVRRTAVARGENAGRQLSESNIVRSLTPVAMWNGPSLTVTAAVPAAERAAIILQARDGRILGAARVELSAGAAG